MAQFLKRATLGRLVTAEGGASDPELAEVRLTVDEYKEMWKRIRQAEEDKRQAFSEIEKTKKNADLRIEERTRLMNRQLNQYKEDVDWNAAYKVELAETAKKAAEKKEKEALAKAELVNEELKKQEALNRNLKRIARERANAARGITPKKNHDGYLVLSSRQWVEHYDYKLSEEEYNAKPEEFKACHRFPYTEHRTADVWKSILQTPYDASLPLNQIRGLVEDDDLWDNHILRDLGCSEMNASDINGLYHTFDQDDQGHEYNGMYKWNFIANYKSGFWELEIYTTKNLRVPEHRRPRSNIQKSKKRKNDAERYNSDHLLMDIEFEV